MRQRDLGGRRALGVDRYSLVALVTLRTVIAAAAGAWSTRTPGGFMVGVVTLAVLTAAVAAAPPALIAAYRDPVAVLRTA